MGKISDELREFNDTYYLARKPYKKLKALANRIDTEMVELPRDMDGETIHLGDKIYDLNWNEKTVLSLHLHEKAHTMDGTSPLWTVSFGFGPQMAPRHLTHKTKDSWERIAHDIETVFPIDGEDSKRFSRELADRIRKLAKEGE